MLVVLASRFGAGKEMDSFFAATTIPQVITAVLLGTLSIALIPIFLETRTRDESEAWKMSSIVLNLLVLLLGGLALGANIFAKVIMAASNPGLDRNSVRLAVSLFRVLMVSQVFSGASILLINIHYSLRFFFRGALAQAGGSALVLLFVLLFQSTLGLKSVAYGTLAGACFQFFFLLPIFTKAGRYQFSFDFKKKEIARLGWLMLPLVIGSLFYKTNVLVERFIASRLGEGSISYLSYASKIVAALLLVITQGVSTTLFQRMSEYAARKDFRNLGDLLSKGIRALLLVAIPVIFYVAIARFELVRLIFQRGGFDVHATRAVGNLLLAYMGYFLVGVVGTPLVNTLYSLQKTLLVAAVGVLGFLFYVCVAVFLSFRFSYIGVALASSIQYIANFFVFFAIVQKVLGKMDQRVILQCVRKAMIAAAGASMLSLFVYRAFSLSRFRPFSFVVLSLGAFFVYLIVLALYRTDELRFFKFDFLLFRK